MRRHLRPRPGKKYRDHMSKTKGEPPELSDVWLIALDIDGTTIDRDGVLSEAVAAQARRVEAEGHHIMFATGRSFKATQPVLARLGIKPQYLVCSNGAVTLRRDDTHPSGYARDWV